jgi:hypothetical protein
VHGRTLVSITHLLTIAGVIAGSCSGCCAGSSVEPAPAPLAPPLPAAVPDVPAALPPPPPPAPYVEPPSRLEAPSLALAIERAATGTPQRADAPQLFARARPVEGEIHRGLLVCRAQIRGSYDDSLFAGGADVAMSVTIGQGEAMSTGQHSSRTFTFPIANLETGTTVAASVVDVDVLFSDPIGGGSASYERTPFTIEHTNATIECRALASVEAEAQRALTRFRRALDGFHTGEPDLVAGDLGFPSIEPVRLAAQDVASWVGWNDPELRAGFAHARELDHAYAATIGRAVVARHDALPPMNEPTNAGDRTLRIVRVACDDEARALRAEMGVQVSDRREPACHVIVEVEARRAMRLAPRPPSVDEAWTLSEDGTRERAQRIATHCGDEWLRADAPRSMQRGDRCEVHLGVSAPGAVLRVGAELSSTPLLLRFD